jgi:hypothetical protein
MLPVAGVSIALGVIASAAILAAFQPLPSLHRPSAKAKIGGIGHTFRRSDAADDGNGLQAI